MCFNNEILFSTRFSTTFSTIFSTIFENIKIGILVPFWATIFAQDTLNSSFISKKIALSIADAFRNIHFLPHFYQFSEWIRCTICKINANLLIIYQNINICKQDTLYLFLISKNNWRFPRKRFPKHALFDTFFTIFKSEWGL